MIITRVIATCLFSLLSVIVAGQTDLELAEYYYNNGEYEQALLYYEKIYKTNRTTKVYDKYMGTLIALGEYDEAEKIIKKKIKSSKKPAKDIVSLGELYKKIGREEDAREQYEKALKEIQPGRSPVVQLANAFIKLGEYGYAEKTYIKGRKIATDGYEFHYEMANLQGMMGNHEAMISSFMDLLIVSPNYIQTVQNSLNRNLSLQENAEKANLLKTELLKRVQRHPDETIYNELLIWLFLQKKEFGAALVQAKALDKLLMENGHRLMDIAQLAMSNEDYGTAKQAYSAVIAKGDLYDYYVPARIDLLQVRLQTLTDSPGWAREDMENLAMSYEMTIDELGRTASTAMMLKELAHIRGFFLGDTQSAAAILEEALEIPGMYPKIEAVIKLELGDILLLQGDIWDASLLYSQVELDFKEDIMGHEAKFRNAKISYYTGDFEWAQAQLDVLKASTSKLISNDAIDLSLLITDNFNMDTTIAPMLLFAQAELMSYQNQKDRAMEKIDSILTEYPDHALTDEIYFLKAEIYEKEGDFATSATFLQKIIDDYWDDIIADDAIFKMAEFNQFIFEDFEKAKALYEELIVDYPGSLYVVEARRRFRELRGDAIE